MHPCCPCMLQGARAQPVRYSVSDDTSVQDYRSRAQVELVQARQNLVTVTAECDALGQKADQQASDLASGNSIIKDLQSDVHRASTNEKARPLPAGIHVTTPSFVSLRRLKQKAAEKDLEPVSTCRQCAIIPAAKLVGAPATMLSSSVMFICCSVNRKQSSELPR